MVLGISRFIGFINCKLSPSTGFWREPLWVFEFDTTEAFTFSYGVQNLKVDLSVHTVPRLFSTTSFGFEERLSCLKNLAKQRGFFLVCELHDERTTPNSACKTLQRQRQTKNVTAFKHLAHMSCRFPRRPGKVEKLCHLAIQPKTDKSNAYLWLIGSKTPLRSIRIKSASEKPASVKVRNKHRDVYQHGLSHVNQMSTIGLTSKIRNCQASSFAPNAAATINARSPACHGLSWRMSLKPPRVSTGSRNTLLSVHINHMNTYEHEEKDTDRHQRTNSGNKIAKKLNELSLEI